MTVYNATIMASALLSITLIVILGGTINKKVVTHDFYTEKIAETIQRQNEERAQAKAKEENEKKMAAKGFKSQ